MTGLVTDAFNMGEAFRQWEYSATKTLRICRSGISSFDQQVKGRDPALKFSQKEKL
jgi:hypothetical protein